MLFPSVLGAYQDHILFMFCYFNDNVRTTISLSIKTFVKQKSCIQLTYLCTSFKHQAIPPLLSILPLLSPYHNLIQQKVTGGFGKPCHCSNHGTETPRYHCSYEKGQRAEGRYQDAPDILRANSHTSQEP